MFRKEENPATFECNNRRILTDAEIQTNDPTIVKCGHKKCEAPLVSDISACRPKPETMYVQNLRKFSCGGERLFSNRESGVLISSSASGNQRIKCGHPRCSGYFDKDQNETPVPKSKCSII